MRRLGLMLAILVTTATLLCPCQATSDLHPLILVPGDGGSQLEARLTSDYKTWNPLCSRWYPSEKDEEGWFRLWFDPSTLFPPFTECFAERSKLYYDADSDDFYNAPGVETRAPHFGSTQSLLYLNPDIKYLTEYMATLVASLKQIGYVEGESLFGAPYDFRYGLAAKGHPSRVGSKYLQDLKDLIEYASNSSGGKPVILTTHSLGGLFVLNLLNRNSLSWRQQFIKHVVTLSAPWGGAVDEMLAFASGYTLGVPIVDAKIVRKEQRNSESNLWLLPNPNIFGSQKTLVTTTNASYSAGDIPQFLNDIGFSQGVYPYTTRIVPLLEELPDPKVPFTCFIGTGAKTPETLIYGEKGFDEKPDAVYGDGDGTVNLVSLLALQSLWADEKNQTLKVVKINGASHLGILKQKIALAEIISEITNINGQVKWAAA